MIIWQVMLKRDFKGIRNEKVKFNSKILILGYTFKENCPDFRNTQVEKIVITYKNILILKYLILMLK